jgi:hypothetical protein
MEPPPVVEPVDPVVERADSGGRACRFRWSSLPIPVVEPVETLTSS